MVKHIILWQLKDELTPDQKQEISAGVKAGLEGLMGRIDGLQDIHVTIDRLLPTSNADIMLDCTLTSFDALKDYAVHPLHVAVADSKIRPYTKTRICIDYEA
ncbi:MAG: Dabb family protein [Clostridia bacterium]|nr:Dabb family protein [Clostridia bacterium]